jgi:type II secretory pathway component GspD/PulD (secretin)
MVNKLPFLGSIPLLGRLFQDVNMSDVTTEMVIYIIPYVHNGDEALPNFAERCEDYYKRYVVRE